MDGKTCLLKELALLPEDSNDLPESDEADGAARSAFRSCPMYKDFIDFRIKKDVERAKAAPGDERSLILRACTYVDCSHELSETIKLASAAFDSSSPVQLRVQMAAGDPTMRELIIDWDRKGYFGIACLCTTESPDLAGIPYNDFVRAMQVVLALPEEVVIPSPIIQQAGAFLSTLQPWAEQRKPWCQRLAAASVAARLGIDIGTAAADDFDPSKEIGEEDEKFEHTALKAAREFLGLMHKNMAKPTWLTAWVESVKAKKVRRQEDAGAAVEAEAAAAAETAKKMQRRLARRRRTAWWRRLAKR